MENGTLPDWAAVLTFLPVFEQPGYTFGRWEKAEGQLPYYTYGAEVTRFFETLYSASIVYPFDWPSWQRRAERYYRQSTALEMR